MRIGLLGAAKIAADCIIRPAGVITSARLMGVAARDPERALNFAEKHDIRQAYDNYDALINSDQIDLIYCALPLSHHAFWSIKALEAGKHVMCEKPFAMNIEEAQRVLAAAKANNRRVVEAFHYRHHPAFQKFLSWLGEGKIGTIKEIDAIFSAPIPDDGKDIRFRPELGGGAMTDLGCYTLNWITAITGPETPKDIECIATRGPSGVDVNMEGTLHYASGLTARFKTALGSDAPLAVSLSVLGDKGRIEFINPLAPHMGSMLSCIVNGQTEHAIINPMTTYAFQLADIVEALKNEHPLINEGEAILHQQSFLDNVYDAAGLSELRISTYPEG